MGDDNGPPLGQTMHDWNDGRYGLGEIAVATWENYRSHIGLFCRHVGEATAVTDVTKELIQRWIVAQRQAGIMDSTINTRMATVRGFYTWAVDEDLVDRSPTRRIKPIPVRRRPPRAVADRHVSDVLAAAPFRERTLILLDVQTGLRCTELANLRVADWVPSERALYVREGKGAKERWVAVSAEAAVALDQWIATLPEGCEWMWPSNYGRRRGLPIRPSTVADAIASASSATGRRFTTHQLRHTTAKGMLRNGAGLPEVAQQLGHSSVAVTGDVYGRATVDEILAAVEGRQYRLSG
jgi:integrase/recombinase XerC